MDTLALPPSPSFHRVHVEGGEPPSARYQSVQSDSFRGRGLIAREFRGGQVFHVRAEVSLLQTLFPSGGGGFLKTLFARVRWFNRCCRLYGSNL